MGVSVIYGIVLTLQVWLFVRWQKRPAYEPDSEAVAADDQPQRAVRFRACAGVARSARPRTAGP